VSPLEFEAPLAPSSRGGGGHWVLVPDDIVQGLGGRGRTPVNATFNGLPYRGSIVKMDGVWCLGVLKAIVAELGIDFGDPIEVTVELDTQTRIVDSPDDLKQILSADENAAMAWEELSYTRRKELAGSLAGAKRPETRAKRLAEIVGILATPKKG
jgi:hypothetical protein